MKDADTLSRFYRKCEELDRLVGNRTPEMFRKAGGKFLSPLKSLEHNAREAEILEKQVDSLIALFKSERLQIKK
jgi:hypothetical protein